MAVETDRLQAHFDWVLALLRAQDRSASDRPSVDSELDASAFARRARTLEILEDYAARGEFPRNTATRARMLPTFVDSRGVPCAVANLMDRTGAGDLASHVATMMNLAYVDDMLAVLPDEIASWAEAVGLTPGEVALIQPSYCPEPENPCTYYAEPAQACAAAHPQPYANAPSHPLSAH